MQDFSAKYYVFFIVANGIRKKGIVEIQTE